jgi:hypothetical protein
MTPLRSLPSALAHVSGLTPVGSTFLAEIQNTVSAFARNGAEFVLRLTPETHRHSDNCAYHRFSADVGAAVFEAATREAVFTDKPFIEDGTMAAVLNAIRS